MDSLLSKTKYVLKNGMITKIPGKTYYSQMIDKLSVAPEMTVEIIGSNGKLKTSGYINKKIWWRMPNCFKLYYFTNSYNWILRSSC